MFSKPRPKNGYLYRNRTTFPMFCRKRITEAVFLSVLDYGNRQYGNLLYIRLSKTSARQVKCKTLAVFIQGSKPPIWPSFLQLGPWFYTEAVKQTPSLPPQRVDLFPPPSLSKNEASMCQWDGRRCQWPALLCDPQPGSFKTRKQLITAVSPSLHLCSSRWATGQPLRSMRW